MGPIREGRASRSRIYATVSDTRRTSGHGRRATQPVRAPPRTRSPGPDDLPRSVRLGQGHQPPTPVTSSTNQNATTWSPTRSEWPLGEHISDDQVGICQVEGSALLDQDLLGSCSDQPRVHRHRLRILLDPRRWRTRHRSDGVLGYGRCRGLVGDRDRSTRTDESRDVRNREMRTAHPAANMECHVVRGAMRRLSARAGKGRADRQARSPRAIRVN